MMLKEINTKKMQHFIPVAIVLCKSKYQNISVNTLKDILDTHASSLVVTKT